MLKRFFIIRIRGLLFGTTMQSAERPPRNPDGPTRRSMV